jgi:signal transduction histidine kinase
MHTPTRLAKNLSEKLLERRVFLIALLCAVGIAFETLDNLVDGEAFDATYWRETAFFGLIYPIGVGWLVTALLRARVERDEVVQKQRLVEDMMAVPTWTMLLDTIVAIPRRIAPVVAAGLYMQLDEDGAYSLVAEWSLLDKTTEPKLKDVDPLQTCGSTKHHPLINTIHPIRNFSHKPNLVSLQAFCLPITRSSDTPVYLQIYLSTSDPLTEAQIKHFNGLAAPISAALEARAPDDLQFARTAATRMERERIARLLHDTLGQSLTYMRSVLDQLSMNDLHARISSIQSDLDRMRDIADDAYEQTRQTLQSLQPQYEGNLSDAIHGLASKAAEMAGFELSYRVRGPNRQFLSGDIQRRIALILREALNNIQIHAKAKAVSVSLFWEEDCLLVIVEDDGVGFKSGEVSDFGHFGIQIMRQRAEEIKGSLEITSAPGQGTKVCLRCPLDVPADFD